MDSLKIQLLLNQHGKTPAIIARELLVSPSVVTRTISSHHCGTSRRVRLHIASIVGFMPSSLFNLSKKAQLFEDYLFCSQPSGLKSDGSVSISEAV